MMVDQEVEFYVHKYLHSNIFVKYRNVQSDGTREVGFEDIRDELLRKIGENCLYLTTESVSFHYKQTTGNYNVPMDESKAHFLIDPSKGPVVMFWHPKITLYPFGDGSKRITEKTPMQTRRFAANDSTFDELCSNILNGCEYSKGSLLDESSNLWSQESFFAFLRPQYKNFYAPEKGAYCSFNIGMCLAKMIFLTEPPGSSTVEPAATKDEEEEEGEKEDFYLNKFNKTLSSREDAPVLRRGKAYLDCLIQEKKEGWDKEVYDTINQLKKLNSTYESSEEFSEAAKRLIINEVMKSVCNFMGVKWSVEHPMMRKKDHLGWGKLDFYLGDHPLTTILEVKDEDIIEEKEEIVANPNDPLTAAEGIGEEDISPTIFKKRTYISKESKLKNISSVSSFKDIEAKDKFTDKNLSQLAAQIYDLYREQLEVLRKNNLKAGSLEIQGILTTGRRWKFFTLMSPPLSSSNIKPILRYDGELQLRMLRSTTDRRSAAAKKGRKNSGLYADEDIDETEVRELLAAIAATFSHP